MIDLKSWIHNVPDFPRAGICYRDITPLLRDAEAFAEAVSQLAELAAQLEFDLLAAAESRGFVFAAALCMRLQKGMVLIRKPGKLPRRTLSESYELEYGTDRLEAHDDAVEPGQRVLLVDDLLATGGTAQAAGKLVRALGGIVSGYLFLIELTALQGAKKLDAPVHSVLRYRV